MKQHFPRVFERIKTPALVRSLKESSVKNVTDQAIVLEFITKFHFEKVQEKMHIPEIENVFFEVFGKRIKLETSLKAAELSPIGIPSNALPTAKESSLADAAADIFGGEVVED